MKWASEWEREEVWASKKITAFFHILLQPMCVHNLTHALTANMVFVEKKSKAAKSFWSSFRKWQGDEYGAAVMESNKKKIN